MKVFLLSLLFLVSIQAEAPKWLVGEWKIDQKKAEIPAHIKDPKKIEYIKKMYEKMNFLIAVFTAEGKMFSYQKGNDKNDARAMKLKFEKVSDKSYKMLFDHPAFAKANKNPGTVNLLENGNVVMKTTTGGKEKAVILTKLSSRSLVEKERKLLELEDSSGSWEVTVVGDEKKIKDDKVISEKPIDDTFTYSTKLVLGENFGLSISNYPKQKSLEIIFDKDDTNYKVYRFDWSMVPSYDEKTGELGVSEPSSSISLNLIPAKHFQKDYQPESGVTYEDDYIKVTNYFEKIEEGGKKKFNNKSVVLYKKKSEVIETATSSTRKEIDDSQVLFVYNGKSKVKRMNDKDLLGDGHLILDGNFHYFKGEIVGQQVIRITTYAMLNGYLRGTFFEDGNHYFETKRLMSKPWKRLSSSLYKTFIRHPPELED